VSKALGSAAKCTRGNLEELAMTSEREHTEHQEAPEELDALT